MPEAVILELHAWIGTTPEGGEGLLSADFETRFGPRHMPLISSRRQVAEGMEALARNIQRLAMHAQDKLVALELVTFRRVP